MLLMLTLLYVVHEHTHHREKISSEKIGAHIKTLSNIKWSEFAGDAFGDTIGCIKDELAILCKLLQRHKDSLGANARRKFFAKHNPEPAEKSIPAAFKDLLKTVKLSTSEFHSVVDGAHRKNKKNAPGRISAFAACVKAAVNSLMS